MNAALCARDQFLTSLLELARSDAPLPCDCLRATHLHRLKAVDVDSPLLILPLQGIKRVFDSGSWSSYAPGQVLLVPSARALDVENVPDPASGEYLAFGIPIHDSVLEAARHIFPPALAPAGNDACGVPLDELLDSLSDWLKAMQNGRRIFACHAMLGVVLRLCERGHTALLQQAAPSLAAQVRGLVAAEPARPWSSREIEHAFAMSGATLRRRLADEGVSLRKLIADARLACSIQLLMTTRLPVKAVAARVGYASTSSFIKRFCERYGVEPSRVGAASARESTV